MNIKRKHGLMNYLIARYGLVSYLEIGVGVPKWCFDAIKAKEKEGVDPKPKGSAKGAKGIYEMTSDEFFKQNTKKYDLVFIDGWHENEQVYRDIENALAVMNKGGFVIVHDCNPLTERHTRIEGKKIRGTGTVYQGFVRAKHTMPYYFFCVDTDYGCGIITDRPLVEKSKPLTKKITWGYFDENRKELLHLIDLNEFKLLVK